MANRIHSRIAHQHCVVNATFELRKGNERTETKVIQANRFSQGRKNKNNETFFGSIVCEFEYKGDTIQASWLLTKDKNENETLTGLAGLFYLHNSSQQNEYLNNRESNVFREHPLPSANVC